MTKEELDKEIEKTLIPFIGKLYTPETKRDLELQLKMLTQQYTSEPDLWSHVEMTMTEPNADRSMNIMLKAKTPEGEKIIKRMKGQ